MLLAPGLIALRIIWKDRAIERKDYKFVASDYLIYSFLIQMSVYGFMFLTYPERTVSFALNTEAVSHILSASFVFKYSFIALVAALVLPAIVPRIAEGFINLEKKRKERLEKESETKKKKGE